MVAIECFYVESTTEAKFEWSMITTTKYQSEYEDEGKRYKIGSDSYVNKEPIFKNGDYLGDKW